MKIKLRREESRKRGGHELHVNGAQVAGDPFERHHAAGTSKTTWPQLRAVNERQLGGHNKSIMDWRGVELLKLKLEEEVDF